MPDPKRYIPPAFLPDFFDGPSINAHSVRRHRIRQRPEFVGNRPCSRFIIVTAIVTDKGTVDLMGFELCIRDGGRANFDDVDDMAGKWQHKRFAAGLFFRQQKCAHWQAQRQVQRAMAGSPLAPQEAIHFKNLRQGEFVR